MSILRSVLAAGAVIAFSAMGMAPAMAQPVSEQDRTFLITAHQGNLAEIAAGRTAQEKGQAGVVRSIGALLVTDHTRLDAAVQDTARKLGVSLPAQPTPEQQAMQARLAALSGPAFDRAWVAAMIEGHRMALAAGEQELRSGGSPQVKQLAESAAPVIQGHLERLLQAQRTVGAPQRVPAGSGGQAAPSADRRACAPGYGLLAAGLLLTAGGVLLRRRPASWKR